MKNGLKTLFSRKTRHSRELTFTALCLIYGNNDCGMAGMEPTQNGAFDHLIVEMIKNLLFEAC